MKYEHFVVRHYTVEEGPIFKGNGMDGLRVGEDRQEAEEFAAWVNLLLDQNKAMRILIDQEYGPHTEEELSQWLVQILHTESLSSTETKLSD